MPSGWIIPPFPGGFDSPTAQPDPSPRPRRPPPSAPAPPGQEAEYCDPDNFDEILRRYRDEEGGGVPSPDDLSREIADEIAKQDAEIERLRRIMNTPGVDILAFRDAKGKLEQAELTRDFLRGAAKLIEEMRRSGNIDDNTMIALKLAIDRAKKLGLTDRGTVANFSVWIFGTDAAVIRDPASSYHDKQNALAHILARYARGDTLWGIDDDNALEELRKLAAVTARDSLIASCRAEKLGGGSGGGGEESTPASCRGVELKGNACCVASGIGTRVSKTGDSIADCPKENRTPRIKDAKGEDYVPGRNGCGPASLSFLPDLPDNPNWRIFDPLQGPSYFGPSFFPACDFHDDCWGTCHTPESGLSQKVCDSEFKKRMYQICDAAKMNILDLMECRRAAWRYQKYVQLGQFTIGAYDSGQAEGCECCEGAKG
jgi:hypothetical protein